MNPYGKQLTPQAKIAARTYNRILTASTEGWDEMESVDAYFDGGEWSGPAWGAEWEAEERRVAHTVLSRFPWVTQENFHYAIGYMENMPIHFEMDTMERKVIEPEPEIVIITGRCSECYADLTDESQDCCCQQGKRDFVIISCNPNAKSIAELRSEGRYDTNHDCQAEATGSCHQCGAWMDPAGTVHREGDDPLKAYE